MRKLAVRVLKKKAPQSRAYANNALVQEHSERQAEAWLRAGLKAAGLKSAELERVKGSDVRKVLLADLLWRQTVVSQEWLAEKLRMKSAPNVSQQLRRLDRSEALQRVPEALKQFWEKNNVMNS